MSEHDEVPSGDRVSRLTLILRMILLLWFGAISLMIFIPSFEILFPHDGGSASQESQFELGDLPRFPAAVSRAEPEVQTQWIVAYVKYAETAAKIEADRVHTKVEAYELVVKDTLATFAASFLTFLLGYAFINASSQVAARMLLPVASRPKAKAIDPL